MSNVDDNDAPLPKLPLKQYSMAVGNNLHQRLKKHISLLKQIESQSYTMQRWMNDALKEKLEEPENNVLEANKECHLFFNLENNLHEKLVQRVELLKKLRRSYSKKQLFVEAIYEKLEREEEKMKKLHEEKMKDLLQKLTWAKKLN